jgi:hypothetical protein
LVLAGDACVLPAHPSRLEPSVVVVEVKGLTESLSDDQRVWLDHLVKVAVRAQVWHVDAAN